MTTITSPQQLTSFEVVSFTENKQLRTVTAQLSTNLGPRSIIVWRGQDLIDAGQYTDADIVARVTVLLSAP
jgi:hypothetical protein